MTAGGMVVGHLGPPGSGKTWRLKERVAAAARLGFCRGRMRIVVADVKAEWPHGPRDRGRSPLTEGARVPMGRITGRVPRVDAELPAVTIARPRGGDGHEERRAWLGALAAFTLERQHVVLVVPEVWRYAHEHEAWVPELRELGHEHRHAVVGLWWDNQDFATVRKELIKRSSHLFIHGSGGHEDFAYLKRIGGKALVSAVEAAMRHNDARGAGHYVPHRRAQLPPWHLHGPDGRPMQRFG